MINIEIKKTLNEYEEIALEEEIKGCPNCDIIDDLLEWKGMEWEFEGVSVRHCPECGSKLPEINIKFPKGASPLKLTEQDAIKILQNEHSWRDMSEFGYNGDTILVKDMSES